MQLLTEQQRLNLGDETPMKPVTAQCPEKATKSEGRKRLLVKSSLPKPLPSLEAIQTDLVATDTNSPKLFTFIDLFAGIGGFRIGLERAGGRCVFSCEWDKYAQQTYKAWFGEEPEGDIREVDPTTIRDHDILTAGFPCQPFSIAGVSKKKSLGRDHGFKDKTQGTLFFHIANIVDVKRPPVLILENVKNLLSHDGGRTWDVIYSTLRSLRYSVYFDVIDAIHYVPQHRERVFIVGFDEDVFGESPPFKFPEPPIGRKPILKDILDRSVGPKYTLTDHLWKYLRDYAEKHRKNGNGFGFGLADIEGHTRTLSARYYKDGSEILIPQGDKRNPRRLTPMEAGRLMGFGGYTPVVSDTQAYKQFGNALVPAIAEVVAIQVLHTLAWKIEHSGNGCLIKKSGK